MPVQEMEGLCANLGMAMHAVAQPLTILRTRLDPMFTAGLGLQGLRKITAEASVEVQRLCRLFEYLQDFVTMEAEEARESTQSIGCLLAHVVEGMELFFRQADMVLVVDGTDWSEAVRVDPQRAAQAITNVLLAAQKEARGGDKITLDARAHGHFVLLGIGNASCRGPVSSESRIRLALAEAGLRSQRGGLAWSADPLRVEMLLRGAPSAA